VLADDWSLILFTLLTQLVVGAFVGMMLVVWRLRRREEDPAAAGLISRLLPVLATLLALAMTISLGHLGSPLKAFYALGNLLTSWLSREVLLLGLFAASGIGFAALHCRQRGSFAARRGSAVLTSLLGLGLLAAMSRLYMLPTVPPWDRLATPAAFFGAAATLGVLTVTVAAMGLGGATNSSSVKDLLPKLDAVAIAFLGIRIATVLFAGPSASDLPRGLPAAQLVLLTSAALMLLIARLRGTNGRIAAPVALLATGGAELIGRILFFASYFRVGI
jgi:anaerobic dimethyl sulfoxide reductase subunit C (anchor subunit)